MADKTGLTEEEVTALVRKLMREPVNATRNYSPSYRDIKPVQALNPEQQLAYMLQTLVNHKAVTLAMMKVCHVLAEECVRWRKEQKEKQDVDAAMRQIVEGKINDIGEGK